MNFTRTSNPVFGKRTFQAAAMQSAYSSEVMTIQGTMNKTMLMVAFVLASAFFTWNKFFDAYTGEPGSAMSAIGTYLFIGGFGGFIVAMIASFSPKKAAFFTPVYAILEGMFLGGISALFEAKYPGLVMRAVSLTFAVFFMMLFIYRQRIIKVDGRFRKAMFAAIMGIMLVYIVGWVSRLFGVNLAFLYGGGSFGLIFSLIVTGVAAFSLMLDFDFIERGAMAGAPKFMEWYGVFGLLVSLVWLYINILRLLSIFASRD